MADRRASEIAGATGVAPETCPGSTARDRIALPCGRRDHREQGVGARRGQHARRILRVRRRANRAGRCTGRCHRLQLLDLPPLRCALGVLQPETGAGPPARGCNDDPHARQALDRVPPLHGLRLRHALVADPEGRCADGGEHAHVSARDRQANQSRPVRRRFLVTEGRLGSEGMTTCVFCEIVAGRMDAVRLHEDDIPRSGLVLRCGAFTATLQAEGRACSSHAMALK